MVMTAMAHLGKADPGDGSRPFCREPVDVAVEEERRDDALDAEAREARDAEEADASEILASTLRGGAV